VLLPCSKMQRRNEIDALKRILREHALQATTARIGVLQVLREGHEHRTVDEIRSEVLDRYPATDPATVYRTLETLEEHGLAVRVVLGDKVTRWAHVTTVHHHLVCRECKTVVQMDDAPFQRLADDLAQTCGVQVDMQHLVLHGLCPRCAATVAS
jgi:Fe2+ or Zn2+ uptake regulation protein